MKKVLIITYYWPPSGGAGVQRWLKFAKYLPQFGWEPVVVTVDPSKAAYPAIDHSLEKEVPANLSVHRTTATDWFRLYAGDKSKIPSGGFATNRDDSLKGKFSRFIRGNFFIPDPRRGWNRHAYRKSCEIINNEGIEHVITTSPPHSTQLIGLKLKKRYPGIKWMADLRDPWTDIYYYNLFYPTFLARKIDRTYEKAVLENADIVTTIGPSLARHFESKLPGISKKIKVIYNGYDESDFESLQVKTPARFTISYTGTLSGSYSVDGFLEAMKKLIPEGNSIFLNFTGHISEELRTRFITEIGEGNLQFNPYADHTTVIKQMLASSLLLLVLARDPKNRSFLPGKLFEYIASGRPVLCLGPTDGDTADILDKGGFGKCFDYSDTKGIYDFITSLIKGKFTAGNTPPSDYSRKNLAESLAKLLE